MREGVIKINPWRFCPVVVWENGRLDWAGTKREKPATESFEIHPSQSDLAFSNVNKKVMFDFAEQDYVKIYKF